MRRLSIANRIWMMAVLCLLTFGVQAQIIIETPHARTVGNAENTMFYDITAKNAGTLSASVSSDATAWLSASFSGTRLTVHVAKNTSASTRYGDITISGSADASVTQVFTIAQNGDEYSGAALSTFEDTTYTVSTGSATSNASESPFKNSYDGNTSTI